MIPTDVYTLATVQARTKTASETTVAHNDFHTYFMQHIADSLIVLFMHLK